MAGGRPNSVDMNNAEVAKQVELFGSLAATHDEMANWFGCTVRTIHTYMGDEESQFFQVYKKAESETKQSLRRLQMKAAQEGNSTLLIWLGKQLLGQKDKTEVDNNVTSTVRATLVNAEKLSNSTLEEILNASSQPDE